MIPACSTPPKTGSPNTASRRKGFGGDNGPFAHPGTSLYRDRGQIFSSTLIETDKATAMAVDAGGQMEISRGIRVGLAAQNFGTSLHYGVGADPLTRIVRAGSELSLFSEIIFNIAADRRSLLHGHQRNRPRRRIGKIGGAASVARRISKRRQRPRRIYSRRRLSRSEVVDARLRVRLGERAGLTPTDQRVVSFRNQQCVRRRRCRRRCDENRPLPFNPLRPNGD